MNSNDENTNDQELADDQLAQLPAERLAQMLRDKRKSEGGYRTQLREAEAERDRLSDAVAGFQRARFDEFARGRKVLDSAVEDVAEKVNVAELLGDDGTVDEEKAGAALDELRTSKPHFFERVARSSSVDFTGSTTGPGGESTSWGDILGG